MTDTHDEAAGAKLAGLLGLGEGRGPAKLRIPNPEWQEADRLGRLLLDNFAAQDAARHSPTQTTEPEGTES